MAATNFTPIQLYHSTTASATPTSGNLVNGELAINITDGKLYYKDNGGTVQIIASKGTGTIGGSTTQVQYNLSGALAGSSNFVFDGTTATINTLNLTNALGATYGGTAQSSWTTGDLLYASGSNTLAKLGIGLNTYILTSNGSIPGWAAPSAISVNTATNLAGGAAGSVPYQSGAGATTFLSIGTANQVVTSTGSAPQWSSGLSITTLTASNAVTFSATTQNIALGTSQTSGTFTVGGAAQTGNIVVDQSTKTHTLNIGTGITESGQTKTINIGTAGDTGSTTAITIGSANGTTITVNGTIAASTLDLTNLEVTNIKAKDGTASMTLADTTGIITLSATAGTANGVLYLNGSRAVTSGSALTFDGTNLSAGSSAQNLGTSSARWGTVYATALSDGTDQLIGSSGTVVRIGYGASWAAQSFAIGGAEQARLTSTGLHLGTTFTSISNRLQVAGNAAIGYTTAAPTDGLIVAGNVGIGEAAPTAPLYVKSSGTVLTADIGTVALFQRNAATFNGALVSIIGGTGGSSALNFGDSASQNVGNITYDHADDSMRFAANSTERARIDSSGTLILRQSSNAANTSVSFNTTVQNALTLDSSGNLGIGTNSPATYSVGPNLVVAASGGGGMTVRTNSTYGGVYFADGVTGDEQYRGFVQYNHNFGGLTDALIFGTAGTGNMTLNSSGNLGLGVTPSAWSSSWKALEQSGVSLASSSVIGIVGQNWYVNNSGTDIYITTAAASIYKQTAGAHSWGIAPSGTANTTTITNGVSYTIITSGNQTDFGAANNNVGTSFTANASGTLSSGTVSQNIAFTQAMTLDASGNLLVGTTSANGILAASGRGYIEVNGTTDSAIGFESNNTLGGYLYNSATEFRVANYSNNPLTFHTNNAERARITSDGYFKAKDSGSYAGLGAAFHEFDQSIAGQGVLTLYGLNASTTAAGMLYIETARNTTNNTYYAISYYNTGAAAYKFRVADSGDVTNTNGTYGTISDAKMKTDIVDAGSQWSDIKALRFRKFKMKDDPSGLVQLGVVAQEVELTSPGLVDEHADKDAEGNDLGTTTKSVKTSVLLMKAAVALQEAMARIEQLEAKVAALEAK